jgi:hypothetical protein
VKVILLYGSQRKGQKNCNSGECDRNFFWSLGNKYTSCGFYLFDIQAEGKWRFLKNEK